MSKPSLSFSICCCRKLKLSDTFDPKPRDSPTKSARKDVADVTQAASHCSPANVEGRFGRTGGERLAVEKDSDNPFIDFRHSMLQMIMENEIYSKDGLRELLNCFLQLNAPYHHGIIIRAFAEIWNGMFPVRPASPNVVKRVRRKPHQAAAPANCS